MVGKQDSVHAEHPAVGLVPEVPAVCPVAVSGCGVVIIERLVHPVPDRGPADEVRRLDGLPVVCEVSPGVSHRVRVLGDVERVLDGIASRRGALHPCDRRVLVRSHVDDVVVALVLHRARGVEGVQGVVRRYEVLSRPGLVSERPDHHRGVVHMGVCELHDAGHVRGLEFGDMRQRGVAVIVLVALDVGLILEVDAVLVAEVVPAGVAGVVGVAHVVDVSALHEHDLALHLLRGDGVAHRGIDLLTVHALELHGLPVDVVVAAGESELILRGGGVADLDLAEPHARRERLHKTPPAVAELPDEHVSPGLLRRPLAHAGHLHLCHGERHLPGFGLCHLRRGRHSVHQDVRIRIELVGIERVGEGVPLCGLFSEVADVGLDAQHAVGVRGVEIGAHAQVTNLHLCRRGERDAAEDARESEHVLRLEERAVGVSVHLHGKDVLAPVVQVGGDVKRRGVARILREPDVAAIDPEVEERRHAVEVDIDLAAVPIRRKGEGAAV